MTTPLPDNRQQKALLDIAANLLQISDIPVLWEQSARTIRKLFPIRTAAFYELNADRDLILLHLDGSDSPPPSALELPVRLVLQSESTEPSARAYESNLRIYAYAVESGTVCTALAIVPENDIDQEMSYVLSATAQLIATAANRLRAEDSHFGDGLSDPPVHATFEHFRNVVSAVPGAVYQFVLNDEGRYSFPFLSRGFGDLIGRPIETIEDTSKLLDIVHPDDTPAFWRTVRESARTLQPWTHDFRIFNAEGNAIWIHGLSNPEPGLDGSTFWSGILLDITKQKKIEYERQSYLRELEVITEAIYEVERMDNVDDICNYLAHVIRKLNPRSMVAVTMLDESIPAIRLRSIEGLSTRTESFLRAFRLDPRETTIDPSTMVSDTSLYVSGKLEFVPGGVYDLTEHRMPKRLCRILESLMGINSIYVIGFALGGIPQGGVILALPKNTNIILPHAIETISRHVSILLKRLSAEEARKESDERFRLLVETAPISIMIIKNGKCLFGNPECARILGVDDPADIPGLNPIELIAAEFEDMIRDRLVNLEANCMNASTEIQIVNKKGETVWLNTTSQPGFMNGEPIAIIIGEDITEKKRVEIEQARLEEQFRAMRRLESIGRLAGGVAHDLNNLLSPILGYAELLADDMPPDDPRLESLEEITKAGTRATNLVRQLLAFGRKQTLEFTRVDLNSAVTELDELLRRTIRENVEIRFELADRLPSLLGDLGQIEQVIMNLASNANDAMPSGGVLTIDTGISEIDRPEPTEVDPTPPGRYVRLTMRDTGYGMDEETCKYLFEPFFTTKDRAKGTGLGLATVYGIVKQHRGYIRVVTAPGEGSVFHVYFPAAPGTDADKHVKGIEGAERATGTGDETILIVEDSEQVRNLASEILKKGGYTVLEAANGDDALRILDRRDVKIDLLLSDVVMPDTDGKTLYENIVRLHGHMNVLFMSGYTDDVIAPHGVIDPDIAFIHKPFAARELATKVREVLDTPGRKRRR